MRKEGGSSGVATLRILTLVYLIFIKDCSAGRSWNVDQNRLEVANKNEAANKNGELRTQHAPGGYFARQTHHSRNGLVRNSGQVNYDYSRRYQRRHGPKNGQDIAYSHYSPTIITAPPERHIYKSLKDPADFYKDRVFINSTMTEKLQRHQALRAPYSVNSINREEKRSGDVSRTSDGVNIRLKGATIRVRPDSASKTNQWSIDDNMENSLSDSGTSRQYQADNCVRCPAERTAVAGRGRDRVALEQPPLQACREGALPLPGASFKALYGPRIGELLKEGSHVTVGSIVLGNETRQLCQYRFNVVVRRCPELRGPPELQITCPRGALWGAACRFDCTNPAHKLKGRARLFCKDDMKWSGPLPTCQEPLKGNWCDIRPVSRHGRMTCDTPHIDENVPSTAAPEGSVCGVWCEGAPKLAAPKILTCKAGHWQGGPVCRGNRRRRHKQKKNHLLERRQRVDPNV